MNMQFWVILIAVAVVLTIAFLLSRRALSSKLVWAIYERDVARVQRLLRWGADPNLPSFGGSNLPLESAVSGSTPEIVALLLARGADVNRPVGLEHPLRTAARCQGPEVLKLLLEAGADVGLAGSLPMLLWLVMIERSAIRHTIALCGCSVQRDGFVGRLDQLLANAKYLLSASALGSEVPVQLVLSAVKVGDPTLAAVLLESDARICELDEEGRATALDLLASGQVPAVVALLGRAGQAPAHQGGGGDQPSLGDA